MGPDVAGGLREQLGYGTHGGAIPGTDAGSAGKGPPGRGADAVGGIAALRWPLTTATTSSNRRCVCTRAASRWRSHWTATGSRKQARGTVASGLELVTVDF